MTSPSRAKYGLLYAFGGTAHLGEQTFPTAREAEEFAHFWNERAAAAPQQWGGPRKWTVVRLTPTTSRGAKE